MKFTNIIIMILILFSVKNHCMGVQNNNPHVRIPLQEFLNQIQPLQEFLNQIRNEINARELNARKEQQLINDINDLTNTFSKLALNDKSDFVNRLDELIFVIGYMNYSKIFDIDNSNIKKFMRDHLKDNQDENSCNFEYTNFLSQYYYFLQDYNILELHDKSTVDKRLKVDQAIIENIRINEPNLWFDAFVLTQKHSPRTGLN